MDVITYMDYFLKPIHLRLRDLYEMEEAERVLVKPFHRSVLDDRPFETVPAKEFFASDDATFLVRRGQVGVLYYVPWENPESHEDDEHTRPHEMPLEIEIKENCWCPIDEKGNVLFEMCVFPEYVETPPLHVSEYPDSTRIGWRGPMVNVHLLDDTLVCHVCVV